MSFFSEASLAEMERLQASAYDHVVTYQTATETQAGDDPGHYERSWAAAVAGIPASVLPGRMTEERRAGGIGAEQVVLVKLDAVDGGGTPREIAPAGRFVVTGGPGMVGAVLPVVGVTDVQGMGRWLHVDCDRDPSEVA